MFDFLFNRKKFSKTLATNVVEETEVLFEKISKNQDNQFSEVKTILMNLTQKVTEIENRIASKEIRDKNTYGHLQYKISELETDLIFDTNKNTKDKDQ
jgi:hypothetical protein